MPHIIRRILLWILNPCPRWWEASSSLFGFAVLMLLFARIVDHPGKAPVLRAFVLALDYGAVVLLLAALLTWFLRQTQAEWYKEQLGRLQHGRCPNCRYDLRGLSKPMCPECGAVLHQAAREAQDVLSGKEC